MRSILVVDDMEAMRKLISRNLGQIGGTVVLQAANGVEALTLLESRPGIDAVITDWNMPLMSGIELLRRIRAHPRLSALPVLMLTGEMSRPQVEEAIAAGVTNFLIKPFTVGNLQARLMQMLDRVTGVGFVVPRHGAPVPEAKKWQQVPVFASPLPDGEPLIPVPDSAPCVLVVDDAAESIDVLVSLLGREYRVLAATRGAEALQLLTTQRPDLILLDVVMPEMDGFEVCRRLQANPDWAQIPVIFLTSQDDATRVVEGLQLGAVDYVSKPVEPLVLQARVQGQIARRMSYAALQRQLRIECENAELREQVDRMAKHDLKSPIGGIVNFAEALLHEGDLLPGQAELVQTIHESAWRVLDLVNLSLDLYRIERGAYTLVPVRVDLLQLIRRILKERQSEIVSKCLHPTLTARELDGSRAASFQVLGDPLLSYSLFSNLIKNAVEAAPSGGRLAIVMQCGDGGDSEVRISNSGAVPLEIRDRFFDKFVTAGKAGGNGIGTYSARLFAEAQAGSVTMDVDDVGNETTLVVKLPMADQ